jgi:hypothetical protein
LHDTLRVENGRYGSYACQDPRCCPPEGVAFAPASRPAAEALRPGGPADAVLLAAPEMVPVPEAHRRTDGLSLGRRHGAEVYTTRAMLDTETRLLPAAAHTGALMLEPDRAAGRARHRLGAHRGAAVARPRNPPRH